MRSKVLTIEVKGYGNFLGMEKGCFILRDKHGNVQRIPLFENEIGKITVTSGNLISTGVLACCGFWDIPIIVKTRNGNPVAVLRSLDDDRHVETRIAQYEALKNGKGVKIAKTIVYSRIESQNMVLKKYGLKQLNLDFYKSKIEGLNSKNLREVRKRLIPVEGKASERYYHEIFKLFPEFLRVDRRKTWKAYDCLNNIFNLAYTFLKYRVFMAVLNAHLEPFLGFIHSEEFSKPSLVCDLVELYRYLVDNLVIEFSQNLKPKDFTVKTEWCSTNRLGKRQVLNREKTEEFTEKFNQLFESSVNIQRIRYGNRQTVETLINEEALLLAKYLRGERIHWYPRFPLVS